MAARRTPDPPAALLALPADAPLAEVASAAAGCTNCPLYRDATATVFGEGPVGAAVMLVGEQPGDREDREGHPFVGPAGRLLDEVLAEAGIDRGSTYVTNAVKHFKWTAKGTRRLHKRPNGSEIAACRPWLDAELDRVRPGAVVGLGATAGEALVGRGFRVRDHRGELLGWDRPALLTVTVHPSAVLRAPDHDAREELRRGLVADLRRIAGELGRGRRSRGR